MKNKRLNALTYRYHILENNFIIAVQNYYSLETQKREKAIFDSYIETLDILGYQYNKKTKEVEYAAHY